MNQHYLEEPDMFHDVFGHIPLLSNPVFSNFMQAFGEFGMQFIKNKEVILQLQRLYWYTIEFGMIHVANPKIYGAGIISSFGETNRSILAEVNKIPFFIGDVLEKTFKTDEIQTEYICIESFEELFGSIKKLKIDKL
jgi:phenylalanine-4-hydroxylase